MDNVAVKVVFLGAVASVIGAIWYRKKTIKNVVGSKSPKRGMTTIGSIGIGLLILLIVWILAIIVFVIGIKTQSNIAYIALAAASVFTLVLLVIPTEKLHQKESIQQIEEKDYTLIYKNLVRFFLVSSAIASFLIFFLFHCIEPIRPKPVKSYTLK